MILWFRFHHYLYLSRRKGIPDRVAAISSRAIPGFFIWLTGIRPRFIFCVGAERHIGIEGE